MQWILFDVGGVLEVVDDENWQKHWMRRWLERTGLTFDHYQARIAAAEVPDVLHQTGVETEYWQQLGSVLGIGDTELAQMRMEMWDGYCGSANTELIDHAWSLKGLAGLAILSNSADGAREEEERRYGFSRIFDPICYTHELGVSKPAPEAYLRALEAMHAEPRDVLFIDDRKDSVGAAIALGIHSIRHEDNRTTIRAIDQFLGRDQPDALTCAATSRAAAPPG